MHGTNFRAEIHRKLAIVIMSTRRKDFSNNWCICLLCCSFGCWTAIACISLNITHQNIDGNKRPNPSGRMNANHYFAFSSRFWVLHGWECLDRLLSSLMTKFYRNNLFVMRCIVCAFLSIVKIHIAYGLWWVGRW